ncbi:hypothetical protein ACF0H5_014867 [Mactra antiquata]
MERVAYIAIVFCFYPIYVQGAGKIVVDPNPALIYNGAAPGTAVLSVKAYDTDTNQSLSNVALTNSEDSNYFKLIPEKTPTAWRLQVKQTIDKPVGYQFMFSVYGYLQQEPQDRRILINVTQENMYAPSFEQTEYEFLALRNGMDYNLTDIGYVKAIDLDTELYNRQFHYYIDHAEDNFVVDLETGLIEMTENLPPDIDNVTFHVTAFDGGSPQRINRTTVVVKITDLPPPDVFCMSVMENVARICWKDPTNGSYVMKYELSFQMDDNNATTDTVRVDGFQDETCSVVHGIQLSKNYTFTVSVHNGLQVSPKSLQRKVTIESKGTYGKCKQFSNCSIWEPCENEGECLVNRDLSYTCNCTEGWGGVNCTGRDLCTEAMCLNGGTCNFAGDLNFTCECPDTHYGNYCQHFNACASTPCFNGALCITDNDNFTCICEDNYVGELCDVRDPCTPSPCSIGNCTALNSVSYECTCPRGYIGHDCQKEDVCVLYRPCNQGECRLVENSEIPFECTCNVGYRGTQCDRLDMCTVTQVQGMTLCKNNGVCKYKEVSSYQCICEGGFWGGECQNYDPCFDKPCVTGVCHNTSSVDYFCECQNGHYGKYCEHYDTCYPKPCQSNSSVCYNTSDTEYYCVCPEERYGKNCEKIDGCKIEECHNDAVCRNVSDIGDIECLCFDGFTGKYCEYYDACLLYPCQNGATCTNSSVDFDCACPVGFRGKTCDTHDPCGSSPCWNNGVCFPGDFDVTSYWCMCQRSFYGTNCENAFFCQIDHDCQNGGTCTILEGQVAYNVTLSTTGVTGDPLEARVANRATCVCLRGYTGDRCEKLSPCVNSPCGEGHCEQRGEGHVCKCPDKTERINCDEAYCEEDRTFYDNTGWYIWPRTKSGDTAHVFCEHGTLSNFTLGYAERSCGVNFDGTTFWEKADTSECMPLQQTDVSRNLRDLASRTRDASGLSPEQIADITDILEEYFFFSFENTDIAKEITMVVGNLLDANETVIIESNSRNHSSDRLLWLLDEYSSKVKTTEDIVIETENINLHIANHTNPDTSFSYQPLLEENDQISVGGVSLKLPAEAFQTFSVQETPRIRLMTFRSSSFFIPEDAPPPEVVIKQWVVSVVVQDRKLTNLSSPVEYIIKNIKDGVNHSCAFWDVENRTWSDAGLLTVERGPNYTKCYSYHLTSFAILLDPSPDHRLDVGHEQILTYISYIGCGISIIGLILTLLTYSLFRCLNREKSGKILMNLCSSMLLLNIVFFMGSETSLSVSGDVMCKVVAILLHYFLLSTLTWMLVEAINMYQALITVFTKYSGFFMLKRCIFAWGTPAIIVIATAAVNIDNYKTTTELCFLSQGNPLAFYIALLGPACFILLINFAVFIMVSRVILRPKFKGHVGKSSSSDSLNPAQIRGAFTVMTLLGVTWVFGPLAINEAKLVVNYVFTVLNSLQGFLIFVFRCCFNPEVRMAWLLLIKTGKLKRRKGPATAYTSDSTSSKSESKLNGSFADNMKSNMYNSLGKPRNVLNNDKNLDTKSTNIHSKTSKDLHGYFDGVHRHRGTDRRNGHSGSYPHIGRNGHRENNGNNGVTTIYKGSYNGVRTLSGFVSDRDEFTRL